nr:prepilin-type N-terminal cleavage/methylation domain-containing protein [Syntrophotalea carbinolica]
MGRPKTAGFSLIELMIVMSIMAILAAIANPVYQRHLIKAREAVLAEDLYQMRQAIDKFFADKLRYPDNLRELVTAKYLRSVPKDPFTKSAESWKLSAPEPDQGEAPPRGSVFDVTSGSDLIGLNGVPYRDW